MHRCSSDSGPQYDPCTVDVHLTGIRKTRLQVTGLVVGKKGAKIKQIKDRSHAQVLLMSTSLSIRSVLPGLSDALVSLEYSLVILHTQHGKRMTTINPSVF